MRRETREKSEFTLHLLVITANGSIRLGDNMPLCLCVGRFNDISRRSADKRRGREKGRTLCLYLHIDIFVFRSTDWIRFANR